MQVFLTNKSSSISARELDDIRLNKQITEINQILLSYMNEQLVEKVGHQNHPINVHYKSKQGIKFLISYGYRLCIEYRFRFGKYHMGGFTLDGLKAQMSIDDWSEWQDNPTFKPAYIKGRKGFDQVVDIDNTYQLYRNLLCDKWDDNTRWTKRLAPMWYIKSKGVI